MIRFTCDQCGRELSAPEDRAGAKYECPACGKALIVPERGGTPPEPPGEATAAEPEPDRLKALLDTYPDYRAEQKTERTCPGCGRALAAGEDICSRCVLSLKPQERSTAPSGQPTPDETSRSACPSCGRPVAPDQVICTNCGLNLATGERVATSLASEGHEDGMLRCPGCGSAVRVGAVLCGSCRTNLMRNRPRCPRCNSALRVGAAVCKDCGTKLKVGVERQADEETHAAYEAEQSLRSLLWLSLIFPFAIVPYMSAARKRRSMPANVAIVGLTVVISLVALAFLTAGKSGVMHLALWSGQSFSPVQLVTYMLLHGGLAHLVGNMIFLWVFGAALSITLGSVAYPTTYLGLGILAGYFGHVALAEAGANIPVVGASGAICGLTGVYLMLFPRHDVHMVIWFRLIFFTPPWITTFRLKGVHVVLFYAAFDVAAVASGWTGNVANGVHLAGLALGAAFGLALLLTGLVSGEGHDLLTWIAGDRWRRVGARVAIAAGVLLVSGTIALAGATVGRRYDARAHLDRVEHSSGAASFRVPGAVVVVRVAAGGLAASDAFQNLLKELRRFPFVGQRIPTEPGPGLGGVFLTADIAAEEFVAAVTIGPGGEFRPKALSRAPGAGVEKTGRYRGVDIYGPAAGGSEVSLVFPSRQLMVWGSRGVVEKGIDRYKAGERVPLRPALEKLLPLTPPDAQVVVAVEFTPALTEAAKAAEFGKLTERLPGCVLAVTAGGEFELSLRARAGTVEEAEECRLLAEALRDDLRGELAPSVAGAAMTPLRDLLDGITVGGSGELVELTASAGPEIGRAAPFLAGVATGAFAGAGRGGAAEPLALESTDAAGYLKRGIAYGKRGELDRAIADLTKAIELRPDYAEAYSARGVAYSRKGDLGRAVEDCTRAILLKPEFAKPYYNRGLVYGQKGHHDAARRDFEKAIEVDPDGQAGRMAKSKLRSLPAALLPEASCVTPDDLLSKAREKFGRSFGKRSTAEPDITIAVHRDGSAWVAGQRYGQEALKRFLAEKAAESPKDEEGLPTLSVEIVAHKDTEYEIAQRVIIACIRNHIWNLKFGAPLEEEPWTQLDLRPLLLSVDKKDTSGYLERGTACSKKGELDRAVAEFTKAIELKPDHAEAYWQRACCYAREGKHGRAATDFSTVISFRPGYAKAYCNRGRAHGKQGLLGDAILDYTKAIELEPSYAKAYCNRGLAYGQKGDHDRARKDFEKAIEIDPDGETGRRAREQLKQLGREWEP